jgi:hypothetical protein
VISELDIWRAANLLIREHGADAELEAARLQGLMLDRGDDEGRLVWALIRRAIEALQAPLSGKPKLKPRRASAVRKAWDRLLDLVSLKGAAAARVGNGSASDRAPFRPGSADCSRVGLRIVGGLNLGNSFAPVHKVTDLAMENDAEMLLLRGSCRRSACRIVRLTGHAGAIAVLPRCYRRAAQGAERGVRQKLGRPQPQCRRLLFGS